MPRGARRIPEPTARARASLRGTCRLGARGVEPLSCLASDGVRSRGPLPSWRWSRSSSFSERAAVRRSRLLLLIRQLGVFRRREEATRSSKTPPLLERQAAQALRDLHILLRRAFNQGVVKGSAILRTEAPPLVETFAKAANDVRAKVLGLRLQTESAEVFRAMEVETLEGEVRIYEAFAAKLEKGDSAWVAFDRLLKQERALPEELRTRFQPMINRLPRKDRETLVSAMAEAFGLGS
jgi:hypothetical protein